MEDLGFRTIGLEDNSGSTVLLDRYVATGHGDPEGARSTRAIALLGGGGDRCTARVALIGGTGRERIHVVEPAGPLREDPNVTQSCRTHHPMRIVGEVERWEGHPPETVQGMLDNIAKLRADGLDAIEH